jgi:putative selenate reductase
MSDRFHPISMEQLTHWVFTELEQKDSLFNIPRSAFFVPRPEHRYRIREAGVELETPFGVAAGPHSQMAQNIVAAWLAGARVIELKTVQTLDELDVNKPCIDVTDEGYNVEWSQELRVHESFDEYLRAWVLIHALHRHLGWPGEAPGVLFNMSVGYNLEGILKPNVQWYFDAMADASAWLPQYVDIVARYEPAVRDVAIPARLSDTITLSTMHGCPPDEIEKISEYLLVDKGLHTTVKCNPTLLGPDDVRRIVNVDLGFTEVPIPDSAFGHDLKYDDAVPMFRRLHGVAAGRGLGFGLKLSNTLEVENWRTVFDRDPTMYLSGRPLHAVTTNLARRLTDEFEGALALSFAGGADCFNVADLLRSGMRTITVASDLLKTGGYLRLLQYTEKTDEAFDAVGAASTADFIVRSAAASGLPGATGTDPATLAAAARFNLGRYAEAVRQDWRYRKDSFQMDRSKTRRGLGAFDCIEPPCVDTCPIDQAVPLYMGAVRRGDIAEAIRITRTDNPLPSILGRACDHLCETTCIRTHLDQPLAIRHIKRFIMDQEASTDARVAAGPPPTIRVAIIGAGPAGLAAGRDLARDGIGVTIFEAQAYAGGMVGGAIPEYRLPQIRLDQDLAQLERLGVEFRFGQRAGFDFTLEGLRSDGFDAIFVAVGAQVAKRLDLPGDDADGIIDGITFLRGVREDRPIALGGRVGVIGAGDTAMDCARSARRLGAKTVSLIYRRTVDEMPADPEEIVESAEEGIAFVELASPAGLHVEDGRLAGLVCTRTEYRGERDASGRKVPFDVPGSEFEIGLDTLIVAISQHSILDFFGDRPPELTRAGFVVVDPATFETSIPGLYAGGDVAAHGPSSIVRAAADGKRVAAAIAAAHGLTRPVAATAAEPIDIHGLVVRRARREYRVAVRVAPVSERTGFDETTLGYTPDEAIAEASRCLDCHQICSLCVGVCPNMALLTYESEPIATSLPTLTMRGGAIVAGDTPQPFAATQRLQIAVLTDFCNECGNCVTACPTSGAPYRDKPRLYLDRTDFLAQESNAFMMLGDGLMEGRFAGETHRIAVGDDRIDYRAPTFSAALEPASLALIEATANGLGEGDDGSLEPAAMMATLLTGLRGSMPHLPIAGPGGTFVPAPGQPG